MLCQFSGQKQPDGSLDLAGTNSGLLVVVGQAGRFRGDALEDAHDFAGDAHVRVHLLKDLVDVDRIALLSPAPTHMPPLLLLLPTSTTI